MIHLIPTGNRVLVRPIRPKRNMPAGLVAPDAWTYDVPMTGTVESIGRGFQHPGFPIPTDLIGSIVVFSPQAGQEAVVDGESIILLPAGDILGVVEQE